jgi:hypothetical protein
MTEAIEHLKGTIDLDADLASDDDETQAAVPAGMTLHASIPTGRDSARADHYRLERDA